ncbi:MAG: DUF6449 domain-containing protein [Oscillospiraceae bacterium]
MTLKNSYSSYFKNTLKRKSWNTALSSLLFFLTLTLPALMIMGENVSKILNENDTILRFNRVCERLTSLMDYKGIFAKTAFIILAIIAGISAFSYLHSKAKVDFYHSFPISRKAMFICNFVASIIPVLIGFTINFILTNALIVSFGYGRAIMTVEILKALAENLLFFISTFSIVALCTILCGNTVITLILTSVAFFGQDAVVFLVRALKSVLYPTYYFDSGETISFALKLSPVTQIFNSYLNNISKSRLLIFTVYLVITAIIITIALVCFLKRKSEHSGIAIAFDKFKLPLKIYCCIIFGLGFAVLFRTIVDQNIWIYFGLALGILVAHALSEIAFDFSFNSILKNWKHGIVLIAISCAVVLGMNFDITGFNTRTIRADKIESFGVYINESEYHDDMESFKKPSIETPKNIEAITEIIKRASTFDRSSDVEQIYFNVAVKKSSFGTFKRVYSLQKTDENIALFNTIRYSEEYKKEINELFSDKMKKATKVTIQPRSNSSEEDFKVITGGKVKIILRAMQEDYLKLSVEDGLNKIPVFILNFEGLEVEYDQYNGMIQALPVYESYTKTLALLEEYVGVTVKHLDVEKIEKITIYKSTIQDINQLFNETTMPQDIARATKNYDDDVVTFTNKSDIEKLVGNAMPTQFINNMDRFGIDCNSSNIMIYFKGETEFQFFMTSNDDIYHIDM